MLKSLCENLKAPALVLQMAYNDDKNTTISDFASAIYKVCPFDRGVCPFRFNVPPCLCST